MGWLSESATMSNRRLLSLLVGGAIVLSLIVHSTVAMGLLVLAWQPPWQLFWAMMLLVVIGVTSQTLRGLVRWYRTRARLRRRRMKTG
jgi:uncharacterized integral membrane protein